MAKLTEFQKTIRKAKYTALEDKFALHWRSSGGVPFVREHHPFPGCKRPLNQYRFDFAWPGHKVAVEIEGGIWTKGSHCRPKRYISDCHKYNAAAIDGWLVLRYTDVDLKPDAIDATIEQIRQAISLRQ